MAGEEQAIGQLHILFPAIAGLIIACLEAYFLKHDEEAQNISTFFGDIWHAIIFCVAGTIIASNIPYLITQTWWPSFFNKILFMDEMGRSITISVIITIIMYAKIVAHKTLKGVGAINGMTEKPLHKLIVSALVGFSPYYIFLLYPFIEQYVTSKIPYI